MTPISPGHAKRLGLRKPQPLAAYRRRWALGLTMADIEACLPDNPNLRALREASRVDWPEPPKPRVEILDVAPFRP